MNILALTTAEQGAGLAVFRDRDLVCESYWVSRLTHSKRLTHMIQEAVESKAGLKLADIDGFVAARGPGSFTGLRIGISVVKGLAYALGRPCAGVSSLDGIACRFAWAEQPVCAMMDARRGEVYAAVYEFEGGRIRAKSREMVCPPEEAVRLAGSRALFAGSGSKAYGRVIDELTHGQARVSAPWEDGVSASALAWEALDDPDFFGRDQNRLTPCYLRKSDAQIQFEKKQKGKNLT